MSIRKIYWAGELFDHKDLLGNQLLATAFDELAAGRYQAILPQDSEANIARGSSIRDADFQLLFEADGVVANFDGTDLDSGTVVEFCFAKLLDLPTVLLRTDFRNTNDAATCPDPWNLMCSSFPRSASVLAPALKAFHAQLQRSASVIEAVKNYTSEVATQVLQALDAQTALPSFSGAVQEQLANQYRLAVQSAGGTLPQLFTEERIQQLVTRKIKNGIYHL